MYKIYLEALDEFDNTQRRLELVELEIEAIQDSLKQTRERIRVAEAHLAQGLRQEEDDIRASVLELRGQLNDELRAGVTLTSQRYRYPAGSAEAVEIASAEIASARKADRIQLEIRKNESWLEGFLEADKGYLSGLGDDRQKLSELLSEYDRLLERLSESSLEAVIAQKNMSSLFGKLDDLRTSLPSLVERFDALLFRNEVSAWLDNDLPRFGEGGEDARESILRIRERIIRRSAPLRYSLDDKGIDYNDFVEYIENRSGGLFTKDVARHFLSSLSSTALGNLINSFEAVRK